jgi:hypothetical protein
MVRDALVSLPELIDAMLEWFVVHDSPKEMLASFSKRHIEALRDFLAILKDAADQANAARIGQVVSCEDVLERRSGVLRKSKNWKTLGFRLAPLDAGRTPARGKGDYAVQAIVGRWRSQMDSSAMTVTCVL